MIIDEKNLLALKSIIKTAGQLVLKIYNQEDFKIKIKSDNSPLTEADEASHKYICTELKKKFPSIPILSEESSTILDSKTNLFWCIDPIDGTKEFINRNGEFTINIGLIEDKKPIAGLILAPVSNELYYAQSNYGAFFEKNKKIKRLSVKKFDKKNIVFAISRSHLNEDTKIFLDNYANKKFMSIGSSLKLCLVASGVVDCYPRFGPTSFWDIAAGHIIIKESGGNVINLNHEELEYDLQQGTLNSNFLAINKFPALVND